MEKKSKDKEKKENIEEQEFIEFDSPEDLQKFIDSLKNQTSQKKTRVIGLSSRIFSNPIVNGIFYLLINAFISLSLIGYLKLVKYDYWWELIAFIVIFTIIEIVLKDIVYQRFPYFIFATMGIILLLITIIAIIIPIWIITGLDFIKVENLLIYIVFLTFIRAIIAQYIIQNKRKKIMSRKDK